jgi:hypothetical protein
MSLKVELADLESKAAEHGAGFLLSAGASGGPHAMHLVFGMSTAHGSVTVTCAVGRTARANIEVNPAVTLLWPPAEAGGYSLIADGQASCDAEGQAAITVTGAVLHRPAE